MSGQSGSKPRLTQNGREFFMQNGKIRTSLLFLDCRQVLVPDSSSTSPPYRTSSSTSSKSSHYSEVTSRHREIGARFKPNNPKTQHNKKDEQQSRHSGRPSSRDLPEWLQEFADNLENTETPVLAHVSQDSDSEHSTRVVSKSRKHSDFTHFPED